MIKEYSKGEITIKWPPDLCQAAGNCVKTLAQVYHPKAKPWIAMENATSEEWQDQISKYPSGTLSYYLNA